MRISSMEISILFHLHSLNGTGCKLGSFGRFENDKLYSNATTQQNKKEPGIVLDSKKNMMINLAFNYFLTKTIEVKCWVPVNHAL